MPTYEYECNSCGHRFTRYQNIRESPLEKCPQCGHKVRRLISGGSGFMFKGSGYNTDDGPCCGESSGCDNPKRCCGK